ncbi:HNH endonuclease [Sporosarcina phage Lietuvens]|nr:HNH endonuclease [Sporosarcina phage Lietuvens]
MNVAKKLTYEVIKQFFEVERGFVLLEDTYVNSETPMKYKCNCGSISKMSYKNAKKGRSCKECGRKKLSKAKQIYTHAYIKNFFKENDCVLLEEEYHAKPNARMRYICVCGTEAHVSWSNFKNGSRCRECRITKVSVARRKYTVGDVATIFSKQGKTLLEDNFTNSSQLLKYICKCGERSAISLNNMLAGKGCYKCRNKKIAELKKDPNITDEERLHRRNVPEIRVWRSAVYERDQYTCQCCTEKGGRLNAHHILNYADHRGVRFEVSNGITMCEECHVNFHKKYGVRNTTHEQLDEYLKTERRVSTNAVS